MSEVEIGDRVTYYDSDEEPHRAVVVDAVEDDDYINVVRADSQTHDYDLGEEYVWKTITETSVFRHPSMEDSDEKNAGCTYKPGWDE